MHEIEVLLQVKIGIQDDKKVTVGNFQGIEYVLYPREIKSDYPFVLPYLEVKELQDVTGEELQDARKLIDDEFEDVSDGEVEA